MRTVDPHLLAVVDPRTAALGEPHPGGATC